MVQCKRTGSRSQFRAGVGPLLPSRSERCPAFLRPGLMVRANALHYAMRIRTLHCTMESVCALREWQRHKHMAGLQEEQRRCWQARRYCQDDRAGRRGWRGGRRDHEQHQQRGGKEVRARLCDLCLAQLSSVRRGCQGEAEGRSSSRGLRQVRAPSHNCVQCAIVRNRVMPYGAWVLLLVCMLGAPCACVTLAPFPSCGRLGARHPQPLINMLAASDIYSTSCAWVRAVVCAERSLSSVRGSRSRSRDVHCSSRCGQPLPCTLRMIGLDPGHDLRCF